MASQPGSYILVIEITEPIDAEIGALGKIRFKNYALRQAFQPLAGKGIYAYIGSALNGLCPRILRHIKTNLNKTAKFHWHIQSHIF
ncbi:Uncharacterised protein [uncultured archaeon]|nr:Uncharacterised protein [uncultured archaeon]